ncbi:hypothetical protein [Acuticoccus kandeliae]|uniref:hypothetical protein n=1 Tax=Acuticoccus kandeliae TaxID=2073160 RepID=UPI001300371A|nr:hypothetical protein [Acuticoccus kandeliae]
MLRERMELVLKRMFAAQAREPDPDRMNSFERSEALGAMQPSGAAMESEFAEDSEFAREEARYAMDRGDHPPVEEHAEAPDVALDANIPDGSYLQSEPVDDSDFAREEIAFANPHEAPRSELVDDSKEARLAAIRANEPAPKRKPDPKD